MAKLTVYIFFIFKKTKARFSLGFVTSERNRQTTGGYKVAFWPMHSASTALFTIICLFTNTQT